MESSYNLNFYGDSRSLLIIDDEEINRDILSNVFSEYYKVDEAGDGPTALDKLLNRPDDYCAVLLDVMMPGMSGMEVLQQLKAAGLTEKLPIFIITAEYSSEVLKEAYSLGVMDVIRKPVVPYMVIRRVNSVVELFAARHRLSNQVAIQQSEIIKQADRIVMLNQGMIETLATAIEFRSVESGDHVRHIHDITKHLLEHTELGDGLDSYVIDQIAMAAILHDVGKIAISDTILNKPARLTPEEYEIMKTHTTEGARLLDRIPQLRDNGVYEYARDIALHHHERWDGKGYPEGLKGDEISIWAQIVSLADVYDALTCKRVYKDAFPRERVLEMILNGECGTFNPRLLECFLSAENDLHLMYETEAFSNSAANEEDK